MRPRTEKHFEPCYVTRKNEQDVIFGVNLVSYNERAEIAQRKKQRIAEKNKKKEKENKEQERFFSYSLFGEIFYKPMKFIEDFRDFVLEENLIIPSMTVK